MCYEIGDVSPSCFPRFLHTRREQIDSLATIKATSGFLS